MYEMKKVTGYLYCLAVFLLAGCPGFGNYDSYAQKLIRFTPDESVPAVSAADMPELLRNPDRGLRMETYITLGEPLETYPQRDEDPYLKIDEITARYESDSPTLCQAYVYLSRYYDKPLDAQALSQLKAYLERFAKNDIRILLRFAYQTAEMPDAPYRIMRQHLEAIEEFFNDNRTLIDDTVFALQLGMIGLWGEGHSSKNFSWALHSNALIEDMCAFAERQKLPIHVRTMELYQKVPLKYRGNVGLHDDYVIDDPNDRWAFLPADDLRYGRTMEKFKATVNDGEMPWGGTRLGDSDEGRSLDSMDGKIILKRIADHSMSSFSLEHNYREKEGAQYSMYKWRSRYMTADECRQAGIPCNPALFEAAGGKLSVYDILRYHLGYHLVLSDYRFENGVAGFTVANYGFAPPLKADVLMLAVEENGARKEYEITAYRKSDLTAGSAVRYEVRIPEGVRVLGVRLAADRDGKRPVRFANATRYGDGIQFFKP